MSILHFTATTFWLLAGIIPGIAQEGTLYGKILDASLLPLVGASVRTADFKLLAVADINGEFCLNLPDTIDSLIIARPGYQWERIPIPGQCGRVEVILLEEATYDFISLERASRKNRRWRRKIIPTLYQQAFEKGLFVSAAPCW